MPLKSYIIFFNLNFVKIYWFYIKGLHVGKIIKSALSITFKR